MRPKVGQYFYGYRGTAYRIYRCDMATEKGVSASVVAGEQSYSDREQARKRVYELNGWKYNIK